MAKFIPSWSDAGRGAKQQQQQVTRGSSAPACRKRSDVGGKIPIPLFSFLAAHPELHANLPVEL